MAKNSSVYVCQQCGYQSPSFLGKCPNCGSWGSMVETAVEVKSQKLKVKSSIQKAKVINLSEVKALSTGRTGSGMADLDQVLGGGIVPGMATLVAGEPGIGKSTLLLMLAQQWQGPVLYVAGEESAAQIKIRADRLGIKAKNIQVLEETDAETIAGLVADIPGSSLVIVDSIQTMVSENLTGTAGSVGQVRESAGVLISSCKGRGMPLFLVGHVTKEGAIAGPKVLEHAVDTIVTVEGERYGDLRLVRTTKNRFGPTDEVAVLKMTDKGLAPVDNLSELFADLKDQSNPGTCLTVVMEGSRPLLVEIQALCTATPMPNPRRVASGVDYNRLQTIIAILTKRLNLPLFNQDVYVSVAGGLTVAEPAADLPIALAVVSSFRNTALPKKTVAFGELDLLGNVRRVLNLEKRNKEAKKLGFSKVLSAENLQNLREFKF